MVEPKSPWIAPFQRLLKMTDFRRFKMYINLELPRQAKSNIQHAFFCRCKNKFKLEFNVLPVAIESGRRFSNWMTTATFDRTIFYSTFLFILGKYGSNHAEYHRTERKFEYE